MRRMIGLMVIMALMMAISPVFADDYHGRNFFNHVSDWSVTFWKSPEDRQRIINERIDMRAQRREMKHDERDHSLNKNYSGDQQDLKQSYDQKKYDNNH